MTTMPKSTAAAQTAKQTRSSRPGRPRWAGGVRWSRPRRPGARSPARGCRGRTGPAAGAEDDAGHQHLPEGFEGLEEDRSHGGVLLSSRCVGSRCRSDADGGLGLGGRVRRSEPAGPLLVDVLLVDLFLRDRMNMNAAAATRISEDHDDADGRRRSGARATSRRAPTSAAAGRVISQATTIRPATPQRTWAPGLPTPEPRIEPVATWVVDSAMPRWLEDRMTAAEAVSAAMPCGEVISTRPLPRVRMTRQPPM